MAGMASGGSRVTILRSRYDLSTIGVGLAVGPCSSAVGDGVAVGVLIGFPSSEGVWVGVGSGVAVLSVGLGTRVVASSVGMGVRADDKLSLACRSSSVAPEPHAAETRVATANTSTTSQGNLRFGIKGALRRG